MTNVKIYEQEACGKTHWRVMADDLVFGKHHVDFDSKEEALQAIAGEQRRNSVCTPFLYA